LFLRDGRDLNPRTTREAPVKTDEVQNLALRTYAEFIDACESRMRNVTPSVTIDLCRVLESAEDALLSGRRLSATERTRLAAAIRAARLPHGRALARKVAS